MNYPNISPLPKEIRFNCPLGCSVVDRIFLTNNGPIDVSYKFIWNKEIVAYNIKNQSKLGITTSVETEAIVDDIAVTSDMGEKDQTRHSNLLADEQKGLLLSILANNLVVEETELLALEGALDNEPYLSDEINDIFSIVPCQGIVTAHSSQCISFGFYGRKAGVFEANVRCEIDGGPSDSMKLFAAADTVQFTLDKDRITFGQQVKINSFFASSWDGILELFQ